MIDNTALEGISIAFGKIANRIRNNQLIVTPDNKIFTSEVYTYLDLADNQLKGYRISLNEINTEFVVDIDKVLVAKTETPNNKIVKQ